MDKRPLPLAEMGHHVIAEQFLHLVGRVEDEWVLEEGELSLSCERIVAIEAVVEGHVDATVEFLVTKLLPRDNGIQNIYWMNL